MIYPTRLSFNRVWQLLPPKQIAKRYQNLSGGLTANSESYLTPRPMRAQMATTLVVTAASSTVPLTNVGPPREHDQPENINFRIEGIGTIEEVCNVDADADCTEVPVYIPSLAFLHISCAVHSCLLSVAFHSTQIRDKDRPLITQEVFGADGHIEPYSRRDKESRPSDGTGRSKKASTIALAEDVFFQAMTVGTVFSYFGGMSKMGVRCAKLIPTPPSTFILLNELSLPR
ncbi:hypothetical protein EDC04DRAFT_2613555 [Pisolithus marmoratus]|nr:hypothetical protein EDC04DRAFT_2613555 [Pisolithus marmoratus]